MQELSASKLAEYAVQSLLERKAYDPIVMDMRELPNASTDFFVIAHGSSDTHVEAMADELIRKIRSELGEKPSHVEGKENAEWILIDYFDVVVHIFIEEKRKFYDLESLWGDAKIQSFSLEEK